MKNILEYGWKSLLCAALPVSFIACSDEADFKQYTPAQYPASVEMIVPAEQEALIYVEDGTSVLPLIKGEKVSFGSKISPDDVTFDEVVWTSSNEKVATVDDNGNVEAVSGDDTGYSVITVAPVASYSGSNIATTLKVVVSNTLVKAESIEVGVNADQVYAGETLQMSYSILPEEATYRTVKWTSSNEKVATVDKNGLVTGVVNDEIHAEVTITATALDGSGHSASKMITVNQIVQPQEVTISDEFSVDNGYLVAIADKKVTLNYTTVPEDCTKSLIQWTSSDETIATVNGGVVTVNQDGVFGDVTITATCPETGVSSSVKLRVEEGLVRELFHDPDNYGWYNAKQSGNGTSSSHVWSYGKVTVTTYTQNATKQRGDFKCWNAATWLHAGKYPIFAIRMEDVKDLYEGVTARNITLDASGECAGTKFSGGLNGNNNKWLHDYKCSDGSHVFIYDLATQAWANGGVLPTTDVAKFTTLQFKYADIATLTEQVTYNVYWVQTFKTLDDVKAYIESEGLTYEPIK
ncbi:MAG: DUF4979 domain-containing protein [Bacteroides sp.]|nr:DUF4979 domain-containing protein [Bacteroides sp.]